MDYLETKDGGFLFCKDLHVPSEGVKAKHIEDGWWSEKAEPESHQIYLLVLECPVFHHVFADNSALFLVDEIGEFLWK